MTIDFIDQMQRHAAKSIENSTTTYESSVATLNDVKVQLAIQNMILCELLMDFKRSKVYAG